MKNARALSGKFISLLTFSLATFIYCDAYAAITPQHRGVIADTIQSGPNSLGSQASFSETDSNGSELTPDTAAYTAQESVRRGETVNLNSRFGQVLICAPLQLDGDAFSVTAVYTLFPEDDSDRNESDPGTINSQSSQDLPIASRLEDKPSICQAAESLTSAQTVDSLNILSPGDDTADLVRTFIIEGTLDEVTNAAAFLGSAITTGVSLKYAEAGVNMAVTGVAYGLTAELMAILPDMLTVDPSNPEYVQINVERLSTAILLNNQIINDSSDTTVVDLAENPYFLEINDDLRYYRSQL
jgi:hypothetical protein